MSLIYMVFPIYMIASAAVQGAYALGWLEPVNNAISFLTVGWLGLPVMAVVTFSTNLAAFLTPVQLMVLALVGTIYPCFATVGVLTKEFGWKSAWAIIGAINVAMEVHLGHMELQLGHQGLARVLKLIFQGISAKKGRQK